MGKSKQERAHVWHRTRTGLLVFAAVELVLAYALALRSIDTGSLIEYFLTLLLVIGVLYNIGKFVRTFFSGHKGHQTAKA
jgi:hypothetical protein